MKNRVVAMLLAFFLGSWGFHKFYLNRNGAGFLYLLFSWTTIPFFLSLMDFIVLAAQNDDSFNLEYNSSNT